MINFDCKKALKDIYGEDFKKDEIPVTHGEVICDSLCALREDHSKAFALAKKFAIQDTVELKAEDIILIKKALTTVGLKAIAVGQIIEELEK